MKASPADSDSASRSPASDIFGSEITRQKLEDEILPSFIGNARWFGGKARHPSRFTVLSAPALANARLLLVGIEYADAPAETYLVPLLIASGTEARRIAENHPGAVAAKLDGDRILADAIHDETFREALFSLVITGGSPPGSSEVVGIPGHAETDLAGPLPSRVLAVEQSNSALVYGDRVFLKLYRRLEEGMNPDAEILRYLSDRGFSNSPPFYGSLELPASGGEPRVAALAVGMVPNQGDAWAFTLGELRKFYPRALGEKFDAAPYRALSLLDANPTPGEVLEIIGRDFLARVRQLGERTGALHLALAAETGNPAFVPEAFGEKDRVDLATAVKEEGHRVVVTLAARRGQLPSGQSEAIGAFLHAAPLISEAASSLTAAVTLVTTKTRTHGDYHLGQVLNTGDDFVILDFEGEPARTLAERRLKRSPLRDVAGMLRSFHYAAHSVCGELAGERQAAEPIAELWSVAASRAFLEAWRDTTAGASFLPAQQADFARLLETFLLEKALYEILYELNNRPGWVGIPLRGILSLLRPADPTDRAISDRK